MANTQFPIDGKFGKDWKVSSYMGWRIHPVKKIRKHHNGTDITSKHKNVPIEVPYAGRVIKAGNNPNGYGNYVILKHKINGKTYVTLYGHMVNGSVKVKVGQNLTPGTIIGKMGTTGLSTGVHLHWELQLGKKWVWSDTGKGFIEPVKFFQNLIELEKSIASAPQSTPADAPVQEMPAHSTVAEAVNDPAPVVAPAAPKPVIAPVKVHKVKSGDTLSEIAADNNTTVAELVKLNKIKDANLIKVGQSIKLP